MKKSSLMIILLFGVISVMAQQNQPVTITGKHKVVIQLSSNDTLVWKGLMNNIKNLREGWGDAVQIEVVAYSAGIEMLVAAKTTQQKRIAEFTKAGVSFVGCENTLRQRKILKSEIVSDAGFVPMGVGEVIMKQEQGWSYLKAGF